MHLVFGHGRFHLGHFGDLMSAGGAIVPQQQGATGLALHRSMHHQLVNGFHQYQRPTPTTMPSLSTPPSAWTGRRFLNWFLRRFVLGWRLRGVSGIPPPLFFEFTNRQPQLAILFYQPDHHRLHVGGQRCPFGFRQALDGRLLLVTHGLYSIPLRSCFSTPVNAYTG